MLQTLKQRLTTRKTDPIDRHVRRFLSFFPKGFRDPKYYAWERGYKWEAHEGYVERLSKPDFHRLLTARKYSDIAATCVRLESRTNLLFSFEKMAIRDGLKSLKGAKIFSESLFELLHGGGPLDERFTAWCEAIGSLPRKQTRVLTHPVVTVFPFIADPRRHIFLKPLVTRKAAERLGLEFNYHSRPSWTVYSGLLDMGEKLRKCLKHLEPRDLIDIQSFIWVAGSSEYE